MHLVECGPEVFGSREVAHVTQSKNILVFLVLKGFVVHIQEEVAFLGGETGIDQILVISGRHQGIEGVVLLSHHAVGLRVPENGFLGILLDFFQLKAVFDGDVALLELIFDKIVGGV